MNNQTAVMTTQANVTVIEEQPVLLDLVLSQGSANTRVVQAVAIEFLDGNQAAPEVKYQLEIEKVALDVFLEETAGMKRTDALRKYIKCLWDWPLNGGKRTTREQFTPAFMNQLFSQNYIIESVDSHVSAVIRNQSTTELHRKMRLGN